MEKIIEDLFNGTLPAMRDLNTHSDKEKALCRHIEERITNLKDTLDPCDRLLLEELLEYMDELAYLRELAVFQTGFRLGSSFSKMTLEHSNKGYT